MSVWKEIETIHRDFFWGGSKVVRKFSWVSWNQICKDKSKRGLGVRGIEDFNLELLNKWKWRLLIDKKDIWFDILRTRYRNF